jgi:hypothetical protein
VRTSLAHSRHLIQLTMPLKLICKPKDVEFNKQDIVTPLHS